jgi:NADH:quinone reductase (non-electrogenic)
MRVRRVAIGAVAVGLGLAASAAVMRRRRNRAQPPHRSQTEAAYMSARTRILILGGGFGGIETARALDASLGDDIDVSVLVVDCDNSMLFTPLLWTVADGRSDPNDVVVPIRMFQRGRRFHLLQAEVQHIDLERHMIQTAAGKRPFDFLVVALGSVTAVPDLPGLRERALIFHTPADALELRNRLIDAIEAAHNAQDAQERQEWLTFVVSGGGDTGVELAAVIHDYLQLALLAEYPWLASAPIRIVVVGRAPVLVPMSDPPTSSAVRQQLEAEGVEVLTGISVLGVDGRCVRTSAGDIPARTVFWAAGISAPTVVRALPVNHAPNGAVTVDDHLSVPGYPEVYVVGDAAWAYDAATHAPIPPTAQAAQHMGRYVAQAIAATLRGQSAPTFRFTPLGHLALLGTRTGVARVGPIVFSGIPAWLLWHSYYLWRLPSWPNRARLVVDWLLSGTVGRETGELRLGGRPDVARDRARELESAVH